MAFAAIDYVTQTQVIRHISPVKNATNMQCDTATGLDQGSYSHAIDPPHCRFRHTAKHVDQCANVTSVASKYRFSGLSEVNTQQ
jgi:hypothetical protein